MPTHPHLSMTTTHYLGTSNGKINIPGSFSAAFAAHASKRPGPPSLLSCCIGGTRSGVLLVLPLPVETSGELMAGPPPFTTRLTGLLRPNDGDDASDILCYRRTLGYCTSLTSLRALNQTLDEHKLPGCIRNLIQTKQTKQNERRRK